VKIPFPQSQSVAVSESGSHSVAVALLAPLRRARDVEAVMRDNTGNWLVLVEPKEFTPGGLQVDLTVGASW
jgi:hypothetical protein